VVAAGAVAAGLVLLQGAILTALVTLRGSELAMQAQGSAWAARALFYPEGAVGDLALFPFAVFLAAAASGGPGRCRAGWHRPGWRLACWWACWPSARSPGSTSGPASSWSCCSCRPGRRC
jgi:hypothetical protein